MAGRLRILLFATAREAVGESTLSWPLPRTGLTARQLLDALGKAHPKLAPVLSISRIARNGAYLTLLSTPLTSGDEIAIHPPFSGG
ncbi:MAG: MoaD/ThiS family protein [Thermoplasmata archaeon]|nr:MoaD/ThiS family protein [Thermoplasmata archaeon]